MIKWIKKWVSKDYRKKIEKEDFLVKAFALALIIDKEEAKEEYEEIVEILQEEGYGNIEVDRLIERISTVSSYLLERPSVLLKEEIVVVQTIIECNYWDIAYFIKRIVEADRVVDEETEGRILSKLMPLIDMRNELIRDLKENN